MLVPGLLIVSCFLPVLHAWMTARVVKLPESPSWAKPHPRGNTSPWQSPQRRDRLTTGRGGWRKTQTRPRQRRRPRHRPGRGIPMGGAGGSLHLWEDASRGRESCFAQKAPPLREGEARQNRGVTRSGTSAGNGENMPCGTSLFLGGKRPRNRAGLGRDHPSTRYRLGPFSGCRAWAPHHHTHTQGSPLPSARLLTRLPTPDSARRTNGSRTRSGQPTHRGCAAWQRTGLSAGTEGQSEKRRPGGVFQLC